jgi:hypothetical protein
MESESLRVLLDQVEPVPDRRRVLFTRLEPAFGREPRIVLMN